MRKRFIYSLCLIVLLALTACGGAPGKDITDETKTNISTTQNSVAESQDTAKETTGTESQGAAEEAPNTESQAPVHTHDYSAATCTTAATCSCGAENGSALGHSWSETTCTAAKKCSRCGKTDGEALGHAYSQGQCSRCNAADPDYREPDTSTQTVYITKTGKKYHSRKTCPGLSNAKAVYDSTLSDAKSSGLEACSKCH